MEQLSDLLNMNVEESMRGKREFTENKSVIMIIVRLCSPFFFNY